jgi:hypothetical protein
MRDHRERFGRSARLSLAATHRWQHLEHEEAARIDA